MSLRETPMTRRYWKQVGGTLVEEFLAVPRGPGVSPRWIDAVIIMDGEYRIAARGERVDLNGRDLIVVQTKTRRVGMSLLGQAVFSRELVKDRFTPKSVRTVALCGADDAVLHPLAARFGIEVVVDKEANAALRSLSGRTTPATGLR